MNIAYASTRAVMIAAVFLTARHAAAQPSPTTPTPTPIPTAAPEPASPELVTEEAGWKFRLTPYFMLPAMNGNVTIGGLTSSVDQDLGDVIDELENYLNFGAAVHFEAEKGRWGCFVDLMYMDLQAERDTFAGRAVDADAQQFIGEVAGFYTFVAPRHDGFPTWRADALGGLRITSLEIEIDPSATGPSSGGQDWVDPFVGARVEVGITHWLSARLRGDIGGFAIDPGITSNFAWQADAALSFHLSPLIDLDAGYRWLDYDYEDSDGPGTFEYDMNISGPYIGLTFKF